MVKIVGVGGTNRANSRSYAALEQSLGMAREQGAETAVYRLYELQLPMYDPDKELDDYGDNVRTLVEGLQTADGVILSTGAYHGTLAGITKNALDFVEFMGDDERPYLYNRAVASIVTAGGVPAATTSVTALTHCIHSLRGVAVPISLPITNARRRFDGLELTDEKMLKKMRTMVEETIRLAQLLNPSAVSVSSQGSAR